ncbi:MAG: hypothetical protein RLZZ488_2145 [Pseudomonadota bacterium]
MGETSSSGQRENISHQSDQRQDSRFVVNASASHYVKLILGHIELKAECVDYSPFGMGLRIKLSPDLPLLSIGELVDLDCDFSGSRFRARGSIANTRVERVAEGEFVRLGVTLSRSAEVVRPAHIKRRSARIQMNESVSPMVTISDELRFGNTIYGKVTDVSAGGMRLIIDRHPLPFLEKQRYWFDISLPVFGLCRAYCRVAYVRREENSRRYIVGCEYVDGGGQDNLHALGDWLYYSNFWLSLADIRAAGFSLNHLDSSDEKNRVLVNASSYAVEGGADPASPEKSIPHGGPVHARAGELERFELTLNRDIESVQICAALSAREKILILESVRASDVSTDAMISVWKSLLVFCMDNQIVDVDIPAEENTSVFVKKSLSLGKETSGAVNLKMDDLLAGKTLDWRIWRRLYKDLGRKEGGKLPPVDSLLRRLLVLG